MAKRKRARTGKGSSTPSAREQYRSACALAEKGKTKLARQLYEQIEGRKPDRKLRALVQNDLAAIACARGAVDEARRGFKKALDIDEGCETARTNLRLLEEGDGPAAGLESATAQPSVAEPVRRSAGRIGILSFLFNWPSTGGGIVHTVELAQFLEKAGYEVQHFFARYPAWGVGNVERPPSFPSHALDFDETSWNLAAIKQRYREAVDRFDPDHVIITDSWNIKPHLAEAVRGYPYILRFQAMECLCPLNNVRLLVEDGGRVRQCPLHQLANPRECASCISQRAHNSGALHQAERGLSEVGSPSYHDLLLRAFRETEAVLVVNPLHEAMLSPYTKSVRVVTAGMDPGRFAWPQPKSRNSTGKTVLFFAGIVEELMKGYAVLHDACEMLWRRRQDFELVATGDPAGQVDAFTRFVGWQSQEDLPNQLQHSDILVIPTVAQEALGRTAVEAMASGMPVVASRIGGLPFTVADGATGLLCEPGDAADLARKIEMLLDDGELRVRLGQAGRKRFEEHYSWPVIVERHYRPLLGDRRVQTSQMASSPCAVAPPPNGYFPILLESVDSTRLLDGVAALFQMERTAAEAKFRTYQAFHENRGYARILGERKTLAFEEAFLILVALSAVPVATIAVIGTEDGRSTRRILDILKLLGSKCRVSCFAGVDEVQYFSRNEASLVVGDLAGRFQAEVLDASRPDLVFCDVHSYGLLKEVMIQSLKSPHVHVLAVHDCGRGLCNPKMTISKENPDAVTSETGVWERYVLAELFSVQDPLDERLDSIETETHRMRVFETTHGLFVAARKSAGSK